MEHSLGRRPLEVKWTFLLAVTLLLPGVTSRALDSDAITLPSVDLTKPDDTVEDHDSEVLTYARRDINKTEITDLEGSPVVNNRTETDDEKDEDEALALFSLIVKRAIEEEEDQGDMDDSEAGKPETSSVDEDKFSISDLPKLLKPLIDAFSDSSTSEAPSKDDFLSWFPSLKDLFEPTKPSGNEATNGAARAGRRSSFSTAWEPSPQASPSSARPPEPEILPSSELDDLIATAPTITRPPTTITKKNPVPISKRPITIHPPDDSDSEEDSEMDS
ncbi:uncharacterized protein LOC129328843 [Eublepharis macularius]|uniref:Uncharacterized protein LOC129328843 n=1 Tax=Eublepharis macularius TaxID=481883 RepID=A0AA97KXR7_EUBMA|nr:uncharacterized protein LOC129328843 [Eublepharis macularius]